MSMPISNSIDKRKKKDKLTCKVKSLFKRAGVVSSTQQYVLSVSRQTIFRFVHQHDYVNFSSKCSFSEWVLAQPFIHHLGVSFLASSLYHQTGYRVRNLRLDPTWHITDQRNPSASFYYTDSSQSLFQMAWRISHSLKFKMCTDSSFPFALTRKTLVHQLNLLTATGPLTRICAFSSRE